MRCCHVSETFGEMTGAEMKGKRTVARLLEAQLLWAERPCCFCLRWVWLLRTMTRSITGEQKAERLQWRPYQGNMQELEDSSSMGRTVEG